MSPKQSTMDPEALRETLNEIILSVAPDLSREDLGPDVDLQSDLGLDSIDSLNVATGIAERLGLEIPEVDRSRLRSVDALLTYVMEHLAATS